ncbi:MAG: LysR family transcriptional regulator, partial [Alphaproteobacteria bacterium]
MKRENWDDIRFVVAVADAGSVAGAARALGVNHATVLRRVGAIERRLGPIFLRRPGGYVVRPEAGELVAAMRRVEEEVRAIERLARGAGAGASGHVRVTSTDSFCMHLLPPVVARLHGAEPAISVELIAANSRVDLARLDADLSVRPSPRPPDDLVAEKLGVLAFGAYVAREGEGPQAWLALGGALQGSVAGQWLEAHGGDRRSDNGADSFLALQEMAAAGLGVALLPRFLGDGDRRLVEVATAAPLPTTPVWLAVHGDLMRVPRVRR